MKNVTREYGWDEVQSIKISHIKKVFSTNESWLKFHEENPSGIRLRCERRMKCNNCGDSFEETGSDVGMAFTNKGNKLICQKCVSYFEEQDIKTL